MFRLMRRAALVLAVLLLPIVVHAQDWPSKPITIYMGFPAGSGVDVVARMLQPSLEKTFGQRLVIDYKPGAGGNVASELVARAAPDGYTFLLGTAATHGVNAALYKRLSFDVEADFTPVSSLNDVSNVLMINPNVIDAGKVRLLGVTTSKRVPAIPDIPTIDEAGVAGYESYTWFGIFAPKGLPQPIAQKMNAALKVALDDPETQKKMADLGNTPRYETLEQFKATVHNDRLKWAEVVKTVGATID